MLECGSIYEKNHAGGYPYYTLRCIVSAVDEKAVDICEKCFDRLQDWVINGANLAEEDETQNNKKYEINKEFPNVPVKNENASQDINNEEHTHISRQTKSGVKSSINELIENVKNQMLNDRNKVSKPTFSEGKTLEQFMADIIQPHIVDYLDKNIERIVKDIVQHEIQKIIDDTK